jgi:uncharacterized protein (TIGR03089 family)
VTTPQTISGLIDGLARTGGSPALTWYDADERVELAGAVVANWVAKTVNLLVEELDAGVGARIVLDLPAHWRLPIWALAAWRVWASVVLPVESSGGEPMEHDADIVVTNRPARYRDHGAGDIVAVGLAALARRFDGDLPAGAIDAAAAVMTYADQILWAPEPDPDTMALAHVAPSAASATQPQEAAGIRHAELLAWAVSAGITPSARILLDGRGDRAHTLKQIIGAWAVGGSVVLLGPTSSAELVHDDARRARLVAQERITDGV